MTVKKLCYIVMLTAILFVQEEALTFIPNVQLTFFLIVVYGATIGIVDGSLVVIIHVLLDNLIMGSFTFYVIAPMLIGYEIALILGYLLRNKSEFYLALGAGIAGFIYSMIFWGSTVIFFKVDPVVYIIQDIPFELVLITCNVITVLFLYKPIKKLILEHYPKKKLVELY